MNHTLKQLISKLKSGKFKLGITADTSIAHILNITEIPQITIYNTKFWDTTSIQSLASHSPLGFSRFNLNQLPVIKFGNIENISDTVVFCANFLSGNISDESFNFIASNRKLLKKLFLPITTTLNNFSTTNTYITTKDILSELNFNSENYKASWILNSYPTEYLIEYCINIYPEKSKRILESYLKTSPILKVYPLFERSIECRTSCI